MLIAPSEPKPFLILGQSSSLPERYGADFLFGSKTLGLIGCQRKELSDFVASIRDNRLQREIAMMTDGRLGQGVLILEGTPNWTNQGELLHNHVKWSRAQHLGLILSIQQRGVWFVATSGLDDTIEMLRLIESWTQKENHRSLDARPKQRDSIFGTKNQGERWKQAQFLQGLDGISVTRANAILDYFGEIPLRWLVDADEMAAVPGIGKGTAKKIIDVFKTIYEEADIDAE